MNKSFKNIMAKIRFININISPLPEKEEKEIKKDLI